MFFSTFKIVFFFFTPSQQAGNSVPVYSLLPKVQHSGVHGVSNAWIYEAFLHYQLFLLFDNAATTVKEMT